MKTIIKLGLFTILTLFYSCSNNDLSIENGTVEPEIISTEIYSNPPLYTAFCDLTFWKDRYYCIFREGETHAPYAESMENGYIVILSSSDLKGWKKELVVVEDGYDLRDPCFCINGDELFIYYGRYKWNDRQPTYKSGVAILQSNNEYLSIKKQIYVEGDNSDFWKWKVYKYKDTFMSIAYRTDCSPVLLESSDGIVFHKVSDLPISAGETAMEFFNDEIVAVSRNAITGGNAMVSFSRYPFEEWDSVDLGFMIDSPEMFVIDQSLYVAGRSSWGVSAFKFDDAKRKVTPVYNYFAMGEYGHQGYPGILYRDGKVITVYYAVNQINNNNTAIYLSVLKPERYCY